jgi:hypothetical protein
LAITVPMAVPSRSVGLSSTTAESEHLDLATGQDTAMACLLVRCLPSARPGVQLGQISRRPQRR